MNREVAKRRLQLLLEKGYTCSPSSSLVPAPRTLQNICSICLLTVRIDISKDLQSVRAIYKKNGSFT